LRYAITILLSLLFSLSYGQQKVELCPGERNTFTYFSSSSETNGNWIWTVNGDTLSNSNQVTLTWADTGVFIIRVYFDACKTVWDDYVVNVTPCLESDIWFCNAFTPTNDRLNDDWGPIGNNIKEIHFHIYNRWGENIYNGHSMKDRWDGTYKGQPCEIGAYVWYANWKGQDNVWKKRYGHVILIR
jgi:gliding motility-associated-like protein